MADEIANLPLDSQSIDYHIVTILEKIETLRKENSTSAGCGAHKPVQVEIRTLEFWKSVICECLASFIYVFVVCGSAAGSGAGASLSSVLLATALSSGFVMTTLNQCFAHISGAHVNPAVSIAMGVTKNISVLRTCMYVISQSGGGIAGAAFLYGVTVPGYQGNLNAAVAHSASVPAGERFAIEFILTFVVVLSYFIAMEKSKRWTSNAAISIGSAYAACSFVSMPYLNPVRSLGPSFVLNKWDNHWVFWSGPIVGGIVSGLVYEHIFLGNKQKFAEKATDEETSSIRSDEDTYDDLDKQMPPKFHGSTFNTYRPSIPGGSAAGYCASLTTASLYSVPPAKMERVESIYGGTKSLYCKSPPLTRANLNRSQSVYTKSNTGVNKDCSLPRPGPLVPAQSLYPMRLNQSSHLQNQNVQNQFQQRSEGIYGVRGVTPGTSARSDNYASTREMQRESDRNFANRAVAGGNNLETAKFDDSTNKQRTNRPDSMYGVATTQQSRRGQSSADDSPNYSYRNTGAQQNYPSASYSQQNGTKSTNNSVTSYSRPDGRTPLSSQPSTAGGPSATYHHSVPQHSPNSQY